MSLPAGADGPHWSTFSKVAVVLELLRGAEFDGVVRRYRIEPSELRRWLDAFLAGGEARLTKLDERAGSQSSKPAS